MKKGGVELTKLLISEIINKNHDLKKKINLLFVVHGFFRILFRIGLVAHSKGADTLFLSRSTCHACTCVLWKLFLLFMLTTFYLMPE